MRRGVVLTVLLALVVPSAGALAVDGTATQAADDAASECSPPCGEINPRILFEFENLSKEPLEIQKGDSVTFSGNVVFWTDTDDESHAPANPDEPIVMTFSFPRSPAWADLSIEPTQIEVPVNTCGQCFKTQLDGTRPTAHFEYSAPVELTLTATGTPEATTGYDYGKLQLFAKSTESTIYNPGYGIREIRVAPAQGEDLDAQSTDEPSAVPGAGALAALAATGAAALALRRQR